MECDMSREKSSYQYSCIASRTALHLLIEIFGYELDEDFLFGYAFFGGVDLEPSAETHREPKRFRGLGLLARDKALDFRVVGLWRLFSSAEGELSFGHFSTSLSSVKNAAIS
jgi:hypothetical protein